MVNDHVLSSKHLGHAPWSCVSLHAFLVPGPSVSPQRGCWISTWSLWRKLKLLLHCLTGSWGALPSLPFPVPPPVAGVSWGHGGRRSAWCWARVNLGRG